MWPLVLERSSAVDVLGGICDRCERKVSRLFDSLRTFYLPVEDLKDMDPELESFTNVNDLKKLREISTGEPSTD